MISMYEGESKMGVKVDIPKGLLPALADKLKQKGREEYTREENQVSGTGSRRLPESTVMVDYRTKLGNYSILVSGDYYYLDSKFRRAEYHLIVYDNESYLGEATGDRVKEIYENINRKFGLAEEIPLPRTSLPEEWKGLEELLKD